MNKIIGAYTNGTYKVIVEEDGTKTRIAKNDIMIPAFAENCDVKITDCCDGGCEYCYEGCTKEGKHADLLNLKFLDTLHPFTEMALNGNDLTHPDLVPFLELLKSKKIFANMTVNQKHFMREENYALLKDLVDRKLIYGLGVSLVKATPEFIEKIKTFDNAVIHVINGVLTKEDCEMLADNDLKLLILGYKHLRRGNDWFEKNEDEIVDRQMWLYSELPSLISRFNVISFDNLAITQLEVKRMLSDEEWEAFYMGDDGSVTFYIDLVEKKFAKNSLSLERYDLLDSIDDMFNVIVDKSKEKVAV